MTAYLTTLTFVFATAGFAGWRLGKRCSGRSARLSPLAASLGIGLGQLWLVVSWWARFYADTDDVGATLAEWFAHFGRWLVLLAASVAGHGFICGAKQIPRTAMRRIFYCTAFMGLAGLVVWRTVPVYFLLGEGRRDADYFVRESEDYECTCGAVALLNALEQFYGAKNLTEREVSKVCGVTMEGSTTASLVLAAHHYGLTNTAARVLTWPELEQQKLPVIVAISTLPQVHHATLLIGLDGKFASFIDPAYGSWKVSCARFRQIWYGKTVLLE